MINVKKFFTLGINADDNSRALQPGEYLNAENLRVGVSEFSKNYVISNLQATNLLYDIGMPYINLALGRAVDYERQRLVWLNYNTNGLSQILAYDLQLNITYVVLNESQTQFGFNWNTANRISRNAKMINGYLAYTDNLNEPQYIDVEAGIKLNQPGYVTTVAPYGVPIPYTTTTLIRRPPIFRLTMTKVTDGGFSNNYIALNAYQFAYYYTYKNYQQSALSTYSQLAPLNYATDTFNAIDVYMQFSEDIDDYAQSVTFVVKFGNLGKTNIIRTWDKANYYDNLAITSHNANAVALGLRFYDNVAGIAMDTVSANTSFDNVALLMKTLEIARNRLFGGSLLKGYTTPNTTSLSGIIGTINTGGAGTYTANWKYFYINYTLPPSPTVFQKQFFYAYQSTLNPDAYYYSTHQTSSPPGSVNASDATTAWATETELYFDIYRTVPPPTGGVWQPPTPTFFDTGDTLSLVVTSPVPGGVQFFKSSGSYNLSIAFFDRFRRKCGVVNKTITVTIPDRTSTQSVFAASINWALRNGDALNEIPIWAYYYQIHITLDLTTRFFAQIYAEASAYVLKAQDGTFTYTATTFALNSTYAIGINTQSLTNNGLGYVYNPGDLMRIYKTDGTNVVIPIIGQDGNFVQLKPQDLGTLGATTGFLIEIFTPYKQSLTEPYYETGDVLTILNPGTNTRTYSALTGSINGDAYAIEREQTGSTLYFVEAMSPNDKVWQIWQTDRGWINIVDTIGQTLTLTKIDFSDTFINGTKTNGLNKFEALNSTDIGSDSGGIQKLQLTNKQQQQDGTVMLCVATQEALSIYLGETQLVAAAQNSDIALAQGVIGTINSLKNSRGTINPESVCEYNGDMWWIDMINGKIAQYSNNGIIDVSDYKMTSFFDRYCKKYSSLTAAQIQALCGFSYVETCIDPSTKELLITLPQVEASAVISGIPTGFTQPLPSYSTLPPYASSIQNRFSPYDGTAKTMVFKYIQNRWMGAYQFLPDLIEQVGNRLFGLKSGSLWVFNENPSSYNTIFGIQYPQRICFTGSIEPSEIADLFDLAVEANSLPNYSVVLVQYPNQQITDLQATDFVNKEGVQYATFFRDRLTPTSQTLLPEQLLYSGDVLKSAVFNCMLEFQNYDTQLTVHFVNLGVEESFGHQQILNQK